MANNNRKQPPISTPNQRYPQRQQLNNNQASNNQYHNAPNQFYQQNQYPYPYQRPPPPSFQPPNQKQIEQMNRHHQTYNQQMHYNNYYYQQQYMPQYPHYPPPSTYPNNYQQFRPQTPPNFSNNNLNPNIIPKQTKNQQTYQEQKHYSPKDKKPYPKRQQKNYSQREQKGNYYQKHQKDSYSNNDNKKREDKQYEKSGSENNEEMDIPEIISSSEYQQSEEQQVIYRRKAIVKKKDPVLDSKQEIRKWVEARKRNYPKSSMTSQQAQAKVDQSEISILQKKIRKKILLINADPRSMMKKLKDIDILRRFILYSRKNKKTIVPPRQNIPRPINTPTKQENPIVSKTLIQSPQIQVINKSQNQIPEQQNDQLVVQMPIKNQKPQQIIEQHHYARRDDLSVDVIIKHLQMKQAEDTKTLQNLMDYKSNSFHYRYQHQTLQTNLLLQNIFSETSYILQAIRFIVKNNFFQEKKPQE